MKTMKRQQLLVLIVFLAFCSSLSAQQNKQQKKVKQDRILFVHLEINKSQSTYNFSLLRQKVVPGRFKQQFAHHKSMSDIEEGDVVITILDKNRNVISKVVKEDPLDREFEYPDLEAKTFRKKKVQLQEAKMAIRVQLDNRAAFVQVERNSLNKSSSHGLTFKIDE